MTDDLRSRGDVTDVVASPDRMGVVYKRDGQQWGWAWSYDRTHDTFHNVLESALTGETDFWVWDAAKVIGAMGIALMQYESLREEGQDAETDDCDDEGFGY